MTRKILVCDNEQPLAVIPSIVSNHLGIELQSLDFYDSINYKQDLIAKYLNIIKNIELRSLHGEFMDLSPGSNDPHEREIAKHSFNVSLDIAQNLGCTHLVFHHGFVPGTRRPRGWLSHCISFWQDFMQSVPDSIKVHMENGDNVLDSDPRLLSEVVNSIGNPNLDICFDVGHALYYSKTSVFKWIEQFRDQIGYVHLNNNYGKSDEHLGLDQGVLDMKEVCEALQSYALNATWAIEVQLSEVEQSIQWLNVNGFLEK